MMTSTEIEVRVIAISSVSDRIKKFTIESVNKNLLPSFAPGAHIVVSINDNGRLRRNPYSLMSTPSDLKTYQISVLRCNESRGGSAYMHYHLKVNDTLIIGNPINFFPINAIAKRHLLIAGGIGITPFLPMMEVMNKSGKFFELYYSVRSRQSDAFVDDLELCYGDRINVVETSQSGRMDFREILKNCPLGTHLYVCAPRSMINDVLQMARNLGWAEENLHRELFLAPPPGDPFTVSLAKSGRSVVVAEHQSLLESFEAAGLDVPYLCRGGACGQCETSVISFHGQLLHNDIFLTDEEKSSGTKIMPCVSRFVGSNLTLDL